MRPRSANEWRDFWRDGGERELAAQLIPLGRPATPGEAAGPIFFLCSPWSNFVHGQVITASGGQTTGMTS